MLPLHSNLVIFKWEVAKTMPKTTPALHSNLVIFKSKYFLDFSNKYLSLHSNLVIFKSFLKFLYPIAITLYIPIWLYSNPYPIIPSIQAILNYIFCLPIYLQVQNDYLVYSLLLLIILLPLFYNNCRTLYIL